VAKTNTENAAKAFNLFLLRQKCILDFLAKTNTENAAKAFY
jgi:hypothetical protein